MAYLPGRESNLMMLRRMVIVMMFSATGLAVSFGLCQENRLAGQNVAAEQIGKAATDSKKLVQESRSYFDQEIKPLQAAGSAKMSEYQARLSLQARYLDELKRADDDSLGKIREELQQTADRLKMLVRLESVLADMNPDAIQKALEKGNLEFAEIEQQRNEASKPINQQISLLVQANNHRNEDLTNALNPFFKEAGTDDLSGLVRKFPSANFAYSHYTCRFEDEKQGIVLNINLQLQTTLSTAGRAVEQIDGKHFVYQWNDDQVLLLLNGFQLSIYDSSGKLQKHKLMAAVKQLVDLDGLSRLAESLVK